MIKKEIIAKIQEIANEYLGHGGLDFSKTHVRLTKSELEEQLENAEKMIIVKREAELLREKYDKQKWRFIAVFPLSCTEEERQDRIELNNLLRSANDIWFTIY